MTTTFSTTPTGSSTPVTPDTPGASNLGWGVNAQSGIFLETYLQPIFDKEKLFPAKKPIIQQVTETIVNDHSFTGATGYDYLNQQSVHVGVSGQYAGFSGSLSASFGTTQEEEVTTNFGSYQYINQLYQLTIPTADYPSILSSDFTTALNNMEPMDFYNTYGPYFTSAVMVGGTLNASIYTAAQTTYTDQTMSVSASAAYQEGISSGKVDTQYTYFDDTTKTTYTCETGLTLVGGTAAYLSNGAFDTTTWKQSVTANPATINYVLTPMSDLLPAGQRQTDLINALDAYFNQPDSNLLTPLTLRTFTATSSVNSAEAINVIVDPGYKVLGGGASLNNQSSNDNQFLTSSSVVKGTPPNQWNSSAKSFYAVTNASLTSYAIAVYDPADLLDVEVFLVNSGPTTSDTYSFLGIKATVGGGYTMTGGGIATTPSDPNGLMIMASYPSSPTEWNASASCHAWEPCTGTVTVSAIGIKWHDPSGKPLLVMVPTEITSNQWSETPIQTVGTAAKCVMVGGGVNINSGSATPINSNTLQNSYPSSPTEWTASGHDDANVPCDALITAYSVGLQVMWQASDGSNVYLPFGPGCLTPPAGCVPPASNP